MRDYYIRFLKRILPIKGEEYINQLKELGVITQEEFNEIINENI